MALPSKKPTKNTSQNGIGFVSNLGFEFQKNVPPIEWRNLACSGGEVEGVEGEDLYIFSSAEHQIRINARELYAMLRQHFAEKDTTSCESDQLD